MTRTTRPRRGWLRDLPDPRDFSAKTASVGKVLRRSKKRERARKQLDRYVDLRQWCSPIEDQGDLGSCTAQAGVGLMEYFQRRAFGRHLDGSRLFVYRLSRRLDGLYGDSGAHLRTTMKTMAVFGVPPERHWPYDPTRMEEEPDAFHYSFAQAFQALQYYRLDPTGRRPRKILRDVKISIASELPCMFGFSTFPSIDHTWDTGDIPYPEPDESTDSGHAVVAVGYDDRRTIGSETGALLVRNSWGEGWGEDGYGWLPYRYVLDGLADDFWTLVDAGFADTSLFE